jgi:hypothetical protein
MRSVVTEAMGIGSTFLRERESGAEVGRVARHVAYAVEADSGVVMRCKIKITTHGPSSLFERCLRRGPQARPCATGAHTIADDRVI